MDQNSPLPPLPPILTQDLSEEDRVYNAEAYADFQACLTVKQTAYPELDNMNPILYVDESVKRVNGYLPPTDPEQVGPNIFFNKTRNKRNIIAAFVAAQRPRAEITARSENSTLTDKAIATILSNAYDYFMDKENADEVYLDWVMEALDKGTGVLYEYYDYHERKIKPVSKINWSNGEQEYKEETVVERDEPRAKVWPLERVYWPNMYCTDVQDQPYIFLQEYTLKSVAAKTYSKFANWKYVPSKTMLSQMETMWGLFSFEMWQDRVTDPHVEILHRFRKSDDTHDIFINGVRMTKRGNPFLEDHKQYPVIFQYYEKHSNFMMGKSLPMKIVYSQDTFNELGNTHLKRSRSSAQVSFVTSIESEIDQDSVGSYEIIRTDDDAQMREMKVDSVKQGDVLYWDRIAAEIDESTVDKSLSGAISSDTATGILNAMRQSTQNLGPQLIYIYAAAQKHAELRLSNIMQFFFNKRLKGEAFQMKEINIGGIKLQDGKKGVRIIRVIDNDDKRPSEEEHKAELARGIVQREDKDGKIQYVLETNYDIVYVTPQDIEDVQEKIRIIGTSSLPDIKSLDRATVLELAKVLSSPAFQKNTDYRSVEEKIIEKYDYIPEDFMKSEEQMQQEAMEAQSAMTQGAEQPQPGQTQAPLEGGIEGPTELVQQMTGTKAPGVKQLMRMA